MAQSMRGTKFRQLPLLSCHCLRFRSVFSLLFSLRPVRPIFFKSNYFFKMWFVAALLLASSSTVHAGPYLSARQELDRKSSSNSTAGGVDQSLVPEFGVAQGIRTNGEQANNCEGFNGASPVQIPCFCPPDRQLFLERLGTAVLAGNVLGEPIVFSNNASDQSIATNKQRATACIIMLQNFNGTKGVGCPAASAPNFLLQEKTGIRNDTQPVFVRPGA